MYSKIVPMYSKTDENKNFCASHIHKRTLSAYTKSWLDRTNKRSFTIAGFSPERFLVTVFSVIKPGKQPKNVKAYGNVGSDGPAMAVVRWYPACTQVPANSRHKLYNQLS